MALAGSVPSSSQGAVASSSSSAVPPVSPASACAAALSRLAQVLPCYQVLDQLEKQLAAAP